MGCEVEDLGFIGHPFMWSNNRGGDNNKDLFHGSFVTHLPKRKPDHLPLLLTLKGCPKEDKKEKIV
ncbi:Dicer-like protein 1 [Bienertia sinuspersici]